MTFEKGRRSLRTILHFGAASSPIDDLPHRR